MNKKRGQKQSRKLIIAMSWLVHGKRTPTIQSVLNVFLRKKGGCEEIRLAWWNNGNQAMRPADINAPDWVPLFEKAILAGVFTEAEKFGMLKALLK
jgi:hypothetical protein